MKRLPLARRWARMTLLSWISLLTLSQLLISSPSLAQRTERCNPNDPETCRGGGDDGQKDDQDDGKDDGQQTQGGSGRSR
ncbi:MAG: hypothetical protein KME07_14380 [Pegethrix bostrychoides GSE-TBD4-15B]|uniref:Uncharacterized protein n=1 Tax=Pegethrix bostrychoides GSE-TBD4-15B TaxID=2839662 RepID=A0A951PCM3_9CYAN|nr:hypothetical protein [Pegethrix bostrychoides GSE-TBD4-15B]